jgi:2Fe-2S ferredoxin
VLGSDVEFDVEPGETVFDAAARNGYSWPTVCGGQADCSRCCMTIVRGAEHLTPMTGAERETLSRLIWVHQDEAGDERLACCTGLTGDVVVHRRSVRLRKD